MVIHFIDRIANNFEIHKRLRTDHASDIAGHFFRIALQNSFACVGNLPRHVSAHETTGCYGAAVADMLRYQSIQIPQGPFVTSELCSNASSGRRAHNGRFTLTGCRAEHCRAKRLIDEISIHVVEQPVRICTDAIPDIKLSHDDGTHARGADCVCHART